MKRQKNNTSKIIKIAFAGIGLLLAIPFCMGMYTGITSHSKTTGAITSVLKTHCNLAV